MTRYFVDIAGIRHPVTPLGADKLKLQTEREREQIFFRTKLSGQVVLEKNDFHLLYLVEQSADRCLELKFIVENDCAGFFEVVWQGYFSCNDVKWDLHKCSATFTPKPDDKYRLILDNYGKEYNILPGTTPVTAEAKLDLVADFEFLNITLGTAQDVADADTWAQFLESTYWIKGTTTRKGTRQNTEILYRLVTTRPYVNGEAADLPGWSIVDEDEAAQRAKYAKRPDLYNFKPYKYTKQSDFYKYPDLLQIATGASYDTTQYIEVTGAGGANSESCGGNALSYRTHITQERRCVRLIWKFGSFVFDRNRAFLEVVRRLVYLTAGDTLLPAENATLSRFFSEPTNYVTERPNTLTGLQIASLSDVIGYNSSEPATKAEISLKKLLDGLRQLFRVYWDITSEGFLRLEHESFYQLQGQHDLTVHSRHLVGTQAYEYEKADMPRYQRLLFTNANNPDFEKGEIEYGSVCVTREEGQDTQEETISEITTDLEYLIVSGGNAGQKGVVLMLTADGQVVREAGDLTGVIYPNAGLSAANLVRDYHTYNRVLENGAVNNRMRVFASVKKTKKQVALKVPLCCADVNPYAAFKSTLGEGAELDTMNFALSTGTLEITLLHDTKGTGMLDMGRQFDDSFDDSFN